MRKIFGQLTVFYCIIMLLTGCSVDTKKQNRDFSTIEKELQSLADSTGATFGVGVIINGTDTLSFNNDVRYPLMSVFKLHESIAVSSVVNNPDNMICVTRRELNPDTWSPMLKDYPATDDMDISVADLVRYCLVHSDNNASNLLFSKICSVSSTDSIVRAVSGISSGFSLRWTEAEMSECHDRAYENWSSPLACAELVDKLFRNAILPNDTNGDLVRKGMKDCVTGQDRIQAGLVPGAKFAHRTGSGYINDKGEIVAVNDVGYVTLPDGTNYSIAVFVKDFKGSQEDAERLIARVSRIIATAVSKM